MEPLFRTRLGENEHPKYFRIGNLTNLHWGEAMKTNHDSESSVSFGATSQSYDKSRPDRKLEGYIAGRRSLGPGRLGRLTGIMMPGLLTFGLLAMVVLAAPTTSRAGEISIGISVRIGPPPIPVYEQPVCPGLGFMWTPGYWAYDPADGYFWVPGTWMMAPAPLLLWTPGYWGWGEGGYRWHAGYWGPHVGFYGGINYGYGYNGMGFEGGEWRGRTFYYNRAVNNFGGEHFANVYNHSVANNFAVNRVSYNGGTGGLGARPTPGELAAEHDHHIIATSVQQQHEAAAHGNRSQFASENRGVPGVAATGRPGDFHGSSVVHSTRAGGPVNPEVYHGANAGHTNAPTRAHSPNPGGGGTHDVMTTHSSSTPSHGPSTNQPKPASGEFHPASPSHNEPSHGTASTPHSQPTHGTGSTHQAESHSRQPQGHSSKPSGGGGEKHEGEPHH